jgi:5'-nucleotidase (lipoprotein e(P4) family)
MKPCFLFSMLVFFSCSSQVPQKNVKYISHVHDALYATTWFQTSGEARALYLQGYNFAKISFDEALKRKSTKPIAVVVDVDETVLDNSPYQAKLITENASYPLYWKDWVESESASALPGSLEFLRYASSKRATVFYITNRKEDERKATYNNLRRLGFPILSQDQLLLKSNANDKGERRESVLKSHNIVLLIGDNLNDFDSVFELKDVAEREQLVDSLKVQFGTKFIILPNPLYGDWEGALYNYDYKLPENKKHDLRKKSLRTF